MYTSTLGADRQISDILKQIIYSMYFMFIFFSTQLILCVSSDSVLSGYTKWSPDGVKTLWCPDNINCFNEISTIHTDHCCACNAVPEWEISNSIPVIYLEVEILDVEGKKSKVFSNSAPGNKTIYYFNHTYGILQMFPLNACDYMIVHIDITGNRFRYMGNISCFTELDTLVMKNNRLTYISNQTFLGMAKLRIVDLSYNLITQMDANIFHDIHILTFNLEGNNFHKLDVSNIFVINKTICGGSYANNTNQIKMTNVGKLLLGQNDTFTCGNSDFSYVNLDTHPLLLISPIDPRTIYNFAPCGKGKYDGMAFDCDCHVAEFLHLELKDFFRVFSKQVSESYCRSPDSLANLDITTVYGNETLRNLMTCNVLDACPRYGKCKCKCTSQPNKNAMIVDCSNQSCTDLPEMVPHVRNELFSIDMDDILPSESKHEIILNMSSNFITDVNPRHYYFSKVRVLDLTDNHVITLSENISNLNIHVINKLIIVDHTLKDLPRHIQLFEPDIFYFGKNGIPCRCENRWIGEWRLFRQASRDYPYALSCSNYHSKLFEDVLSQVDDCQSQSYHYWSLSIIIPLCLILSLMWLGFCFRYDLYILKRKLFKAGRKRPEVWEMDVYISFDDENEEVRYYVIRTLEQFFKRKKITTYIPCRDAWPGLTEEQNVTKNLPKCKYVLIIQSKGMYNRESSHSYIRRMEYKLAWDFFMRQAVEKIFVVCFDSEKPEKFQKSKSQALFRFGMGFVIHNRKQKLHEKILEILSEPLIVNSKHKVQRTMQIQSSLWNKKRLTQ